MAIAKGNEGPFTAYRLTPSYRVQCIEGLIVDRRENWWSRDYLDTKGRQYWARGLYCTADEAYDAGCAKLGEAQARIDKAQERIKKLTTNLGKPVLVRK